MAGIVSLLLDALRVVIFYLDALIYSLIGSFFDLIMDLAKLDQTLFVGKEVETFATNIYAILGILMLFRLSFTLLNIIANPDLLTDKNRGFDKILTRVITALFLIVLIPYAFSYAFRIETVIINKNIFLKLFMGVSESSEINQLNDTTGSLLAREALKSFIFINEKLGNTMDSEYKRFSDNFGNLNAMLGETSTLNSKDPGDDQYNYTYYIIISTAAGIFILAILGVFAIDIALRTVKLAFLQIISPIAVVSYVEPTSSEKGFFKRWLDMVIATYLNLFIRLAILAFLIFLFTIVFKAFEDKSGILATAGFLKSALLRILILIGILMFAKEAPQMLSKLFGIEETGIGTLNPFQKMASVPVAGAAMGAGLGAIGGALAGGGLAGAVMGAQSGFGSIGLGGAEEGKKGKGIQASILGGYAVGRDDVTKLLTGDKDAKGGILAKRRARSMENLAGRGVKSRFQEGAKLARKVKESGNELSIYKSKEFSESLAQFKAAKRREKLALAQQSRAKRDYELGKISHSEYEAVQSRYFDAKDDKETFQERFEEQQKINSSDASRYKAYTSYSHYMEGSEKDEEGISRYVSDVPVYETPIEPEVLDLGDQTSNKSILSDAKRMERRPSGIYVPRSSMDDDKDKGRKL